MQVINLERSFHYNSVTLPDPNAALTPDQVREFYSTQFPELLNAVVEGPSTKGNVSTFKFTRAVGAKGSHLLPAAAVVQRAIAGQHSGGGHTLLPSAREAARSAAAQTLANVAIEKARRAGDLPLPSQAFGLWG